MERHRPIGITVLEILAFFAGIFNLWVALVYLGIAPVALFTGQFGFFGLALLGALLWGVVAFIWLAVASGLWHLNPQAWYFVVAFSALSIILALISVLGASSWEAVLPGIILYSIIVVYAFLPWVRESFQVRGGPEV